MTREKLVFVVACVCALMLAPVVTSTAQAQVAAGETDDDAARRHFRLGQAHYDNGEFAEAATEFDEAYRLSQRPQLLYNVYVAYRDAGDMVHAAAALRLYLERVPDADNAAQLRARLTSMERVLAQSGSTTTTTGGGSESTTTGTTPTETTPTETTPTETTPTETTPVESTPPPSSGGGGFGSSPVGWIVGGVGLALIGAGIGTGVAALDAQSTLDQMCGPDRHSCPADFTSRRDTGAALSAATDGLIITGGVALVTGVVLLFVLQDGGSAEQPVTASCGPTGCSASVTGHF
jgi:hypothetical protein